MRLNTFLEVLICLALAAGTPRVGAEEEDIDSLFSIAQGATLEKVIKRVGQPTGRFKDGNDEYLLYGNSVWEKNGKRSCPEVLMKDGKCLQTNWLPEDVMKNSMAVINNFGDWTPPEEVKGKTFFLSDTGVEGKTKANVLAKLGQPDVKKVFNGKEVWVYRLVRFAKDNDKTISIYLTFEADKVISSVGN